MSLSIIPPLPLLLIDKQTQEDLKWILIIIIICYIAFRVDREHNKREHERKLLEENRKLLEEKRKLEEKEKEELIKRKRELFEEEQRAKGLQKVTRYGKEVWATHEQVREWKFVEVDLDNNFQRLSPRGFEKAIAGLFTKMKYDVTRTPLTGDYGADLIVKKNNETIVVQCKKYGEEHKVGAPDVQRTLGSMYRYNASKSILITTSDFTNQAKIQASKAPIELWNKRKLREQFMKAYFELN